MTARATLSTVFDWRELPYSEVWVGDGEYYPGAGLANGGKSGDPITPLCFCAVEMRTGRTVQLWQDELGGRPPFDLGADTLFVSHALPAEFSVFLAKGWPQPAAAIDTLIEFRHYMNSSMVDSEDRPKGFFGLAGALRYFCEDELDVAAKDLARDRILQGPPFDDGLKRWFLTYCLDDALGAARLAKHLIPTIRSLPHALFRAKFAWATACQQARGVPLDGVQLERVKSRWGGMRLELVKEKDSFGFYEVVNGKPHFREAWFAEYLRRNGLPWPLREDGKPDLREGTFRDMSLRYRQFETVRELRYSMSKLRLNALEVGNDFRNRCPPSKRTSYSRFCKPLRRPITWRTDASSAYFVPLLPTTTASLAINPIRSSTLLAAQAPKNDLVTSTGSSCRAFSACDAVKLHKTTIAPTQVIPCLISRSSSPHLP